MSKPKRKGGRKRGTQHLRSGIGSAERPTQPTASAAIATFSPKPGVAMPVLICANCRTTYAINIKISSGVQLKMEAGAALQAPCPNCGTTNELRATEPTRIQVVADGIRTILTTETWVEELHVLRDELTRVRTGVSSPEQALKRVAEQAPAAAAIVSKIGLDPVTLIALLTLVVQLLAWLAPDPLDHQKSRSVDDEYLVQMVRKAFEAGKQAQADTDDQQTPTPATQQVPSATVPAQPDTSNQGQTPS